MQMAQRKLHHRGGVEMPERWECPGWSVPGLCQLTEGGPGHRGASCGGEWKLLSLTSAGKPDPPAAWGP